MLFNFDLSSISTTALRCVETWHQKILQLNIYEEEIDSFAWISISPLMIYSFSIKYALCFECQSLKFMNHMWRSIKKLKAKWKMRKKNWNLNLFTATKTHKELLNFFIVFVLSKWAIFSSRVCKIQFPSLSRRWDQHKNNSIARRALKCRYCNKIYSITV